MLRSLAAFLAVTALAAPAAASAATGDTLFNILPPGQSGVFPLVPNSTDQAKLYDGLAPLFGSVTAADIPKYFKNSQFGPQTAVVKTERPIKGLTIKRDTFG